MAMSEAEKRAALRVLAAAGLLTVEDPPAATGGGPRIGEFGSDRCEACWGPEYAWWAYRSRNRVIRLCDGCNELWQEERLKK